MQIAKLDLAFPEIIKALEAKLLTGELDAQRQHCITIQHGGFSCEADTLGSHGYVYVALFPALTL
ncbi:CbeA_antitoxin, type IV, cytoskeleton bundling-enhancing factor A [Aeromonas hydrophila]|nr:CbeA_antitoxin, type IV, cytoskeleton bundling-enhancing factor A [Aeromonas hydrophila]SIR22438.1 CbeA_antitoxin, type IV, cytoskeleton bundling-enhancing factor A [Aeromonas hydrophila]